MAIKMKAARAAVKTAKNLEELATQVSAIQEQLNRMEDELPGKISVLIEEAIALMIAGNDDRTPAAKAPARTQKKGG